MEAATKPVTDVLDTASGKVYQVTKGSVNPKACINWDTNLGKIILAVVIVLIILHIKNHNKRCPPPPPCVPAPCTLKSLGYEGPIDVDGIHDLLPGQSQERKWSKTCFDDLSLVYNAPPASQQPGIGSEVGV